MAKGGCYLFLGPEIGEKHDAIDKFRKKFKSPPEETSFYAGETSATEMVSVLRNGSLFADTRLFLIKNAEVLQKKEEVELLAGYMAAPQEDTTLILLSDSISLNKGLEKSVPREGKRIFWELFENRKSEWVASFFRREGYRISKGGIEAVLEMVENNTDALRRECSRLMLFLGRDRTVEQADVEKWLSHTREESAFTLFSRIARGDLSRALETAHALTAAREASQSILAGLTWCFRKLRDYLALAETGHTDEFELKKIGLASVKTRGDYTEAARRYDSASVDRCLSVTAEYDILLRSGGAGLEPILLDWYLCRIMTPGSAGKGTDRR
ncbi:MAG: DNA polymerase III subunit delta [Spirochaetaceae bacterium]|jgi:DNA polymerase-3 subunit delta|nr:DNA polymerase III subunit delta [Spirochaetaceae bacterium]